MPAAVVAKSDEVGGVAASDSQRSCRYRPSGLAGVSVFAPLHLLNRPLEGRSREKRCEANTPPP
jgi:hypothetical protein